ncbi:hypothetical protein PP353_gp43 [Arthrobacter phage Kumotta]|uniref:Uncharacterized protein n=1 Tax=Arthrobacter phage Kumotta TaxID=2588498 RepID=A0A4Y6ELG0_9CAUD|nr:hypothetical protein PP353_gp43 [Arthrobacter phage Kumotta]QDF19553.1 hypothetical protein SEA_KUMOTTA_43 [Arthrobacter phage Kumotta]
MSERVIRVGDEVIKIDAGRYKHATGKVIALVAGGYEVRLTGANVITYENDETIELRYEEEDEERE